MGDPRDGQHTDTGQPAKHGSSAHAGNASGGGTFGQFRVLFVGEIAGADSIREKDGAF
jgi:hypothetical protein